MPRLSDLTQDVSTDSTDGEAVSLWMLTTCGFSITSTTVDFTFWNNKAQLLKWQQHHYPINSLFVSVCCHLSQFVTFTRISFRVVTLLKQRALPYSKWATFLKFQVYASVTAKCFHLSLFFAKPSSQFSIFISIYLHFFDSILKLEFLTPGSS